jgi:D-glycero-D-manno-heptose 1,7-bisphosphate phosphatase
VTKAIFLDRDGVLNKSRNGTFVNCADDLVILPGVPEALKILEDLGYLRILVTNQGGIASGYMTQETLDQIHDQLVRSIGDEGASLSCFYVCISADDNDLNRKPNPGMILNGIKDFGVDPSRSFMVGDMASDVEAGRRAGVTTVLIGETNSPVLKEASPNFVFSSLLKFATTLKESLKEEMK